MEYHTWYHINCDCEALPVIYCFWPFPTSILLLWFDVFRPEISIPANLRKVRYTKVLSQSEPQQLQVLQDSTKPQSQFIKDSTKPQSQFIKDSSKSQSQFIEDLTKPHDSVNLGTIEPPDCFTQKPSTDPIEPTSPSTSIMFHPDSSDSSVSALREYHEPAITKAPTSDELILQPLPPPIEVANLGTSLPPPVDCQVEKNHAAVQLEEESADSQLEEESADDGLGDDVCSTQIEHSEITSNFSSEFDNRNMSPIRASSPSNGPCTQYHFDGYEESPESDHRPAETKTQPGTPFQPPEEHGLPSSVMLKRPRDCHNDMWSRR